MTAAPAAAIADWLLQRRGPLLRSGGTLRHRSVSLFFASLDAARDDA